MTIPFDGPALRTARLTAGYSISQLANAVGVGTTVITRLERSDPRATTMLNLAQAHTLADAISITLDRLTHPTSNDPDTSTSATRQHPDEPDATRLATFLHQHRRPARPTALARTLNWTLPRLHAARDILNNRLQPVGLTVQTKHTGWTISPARTDDDLGALDGHHADDHGLDRATAAALRDVLTAHRTGTTNTSGRTSRSRLMALGYLQRAGAITLTDNGPEPSPALRYALDLTH